MRCLMEKNVIELVKVEKQVTLEKAITGKKNYLHLKDNEELAVRSVTGLLLMFSEYFNVSSTFTEVQAVQTASLFLEEYPVESIEDLILCLKNAKLGKYGKIYNRIDGSMLFEWFSKYLDEKYSFIEEKRHNEKFEQQSNSTIENPKVLSVINEIAAKALPEKKKIKSGFTDKDHMNEFVQLVEKYNVDQLLSLKDYYQKMQKTTNSLDYTAYISLINKRLENGLRIEENQIA